MRVFIGAAVLVALAACGPTIPDSGAGIGFDRVDRERQARLDRDARLNGVPQVQTRTLDGALDQQADERARAANSGQAPLDASPDNPPPAVTDSTGISREQDFQAVSDQRTIQSDAERIRQAQAQYTLVAPTDLPTRPGSNRPNIVAYALKTNNPVGTAIYKRSSFGSDAKYQRACAAYASADLAQEEFLTLGGPEKDRKGLDPDGDGFACSWNPEPFRRVRSN